MRSLVLLPNDVGVDLVRLISCIDSHDICGDIFALGRSCNNHLLCPGLNMPLSAVSIHKHSLGDFIIGKDGTSSGAPWERSPKTRSVLGASFRRKQDSGAGARESGELPHNIVL